MKNILILLVLFLSFSFAGQNSIFKTVEGATNSGITEGSMIPDSKRPDGFIIKHIKNDFDNDGIQDQYDECLDTPEGKVVTSDGCIKLIRLNVRFDFDKSNIKNEYKDEIEEAVKFLKQNKTLTTTIEGHTDSVGTEKYNYVLSQLRAKKVAIALGNEGIDNKRIVTKGYGETKPVANNDSEEGRTQNRRVDISFNK
ncbi:OmpA family protein [Sulfurospirillum arcachonense]|uniref:OmpA family protein n=1 Tax=Sulfurospirillum arcachonense TaxID=57666 RepID=UPI00046A9472|nr:OmpA family protein [Sulfurospirillum arcachonense]